MEIRMMIEGFTCVFFSYLAFLLMVCGYYVAEKRSTCNATVTENLDTKRGAQNAHNAHNTTRFYRFRDLVLERRSVYQLSKRLANVGEVASSTETKAQRYPGIRAASLSLSHNALNTIVFTTRDKLVSRLTAFFESVALALLVMPGICTESSFTHQPSVEWM